MLHRTLVLPLTAAFLFTAAALADTTPARVRGTVLSLDGNVLHVSPAAGGDTVITLGQQVKVSALVPISMAEIKPGSFIGAAAETQADGALVAKEVHVFPEAMRGAGEGHYAFDLGPKSTMTNGTVGQEVVGSAGNTLTVKYKGGEKPIVVPPNTPVVTFEPGERGQLTAGAHVIVFAQKGVDGMLTSDRVVVGKDGLTPPM